MYISISLCLCLQQNNKVPVTIHTVKGLTMVMHAVSTLLCRNLLRLIIIMKNPTWDRKKKRYNRTNILYYIQLNIIMKATSWTPHVTCKVYQSSRFFCNIIICGVLYFSLPPVYEHILLQLCTGCSSFQLYRFVKKRMKNHV